MRSFVLALTALSALGLAACDDGAGTTGSIDGAADPNAVVVEEPADPAALPADPAADPAAPADSTATQ